MYKAEAKKAKSDNEILKRNVIRFERKIDELETDIKAKDLQIVQLGMVSNMISIVTIFGQKPFLQKISSKHS